MFPAMNRYRAALTHFGISALVVGTVFVLVYFLWYPEPLFHGAGGRDLFLVLAMVDVTVGPLITLIIFKPGKKGLRFDLATIAVLQIAALAYGTHVVFEARPVWVVFLKDRFDLVRANQVQDESREKAQAPFRSLSLTGPKIAAARGQARPGGARRCRERGGPAAGGAQAVEVLSAILRDQPRLSPARPA